jgi:hypothetical protein
MTSPMPRAAPAVQPMALFFQVRIPPMELPTSIRTSATVLAVGYLETIGNLEKEIERLEQELMDAKIENQDTRAVEKLLQDTKGLRDRRQSEYEELLQKKPDE